MALDAVKLLLSHVEVAAENTLFEPQRQPIHALK